MAERIRVTATWNDLNTLITDFNEIVFENERRFDNVQKSHFIELILMMIPSKTFIAYMKEKDNAIVFHFVNSEVLQAYFDFFNNQFKLEGLEFLKELEGKDFDDLEPFQRRRIGLHEIRYLRIDEKIEDKTRDNIIKKLLM